MYISNRERFITFEGIDGCGKSTQAKILIEKLNDNDIATCFVREPGGTPVSEEIRTILLENRDERMCNRTEALLMTGSRAQLTKDVIIPALEKGQWVIADRYTDSTIAYQGGGRGLDIEWLLQLNDFATYGTIPDLTIIVDIDPEEAIRRTNDSAPDRIESAGIGFQEKIRKQYKELIKLFPDRCMSIDGSSSPDVINRSVWDEIKNRKFIYEK
jgi:dTMP kinase|tara:strand:+ start:662 stop:1303 length:642 start_codon:yes stop_codon:yes gene_type:complete